MRKVIVWIVEIAIAAAQFAVFSSSAETPTHIGELLLMLAAIFFAPVVVALMLLFLFWVFRTGELQGVRRHMGVSICAMTALMCLATVISVFIGKGFFMGVMSVLLFGLFGAAAVLLALLIFHDRSNRGVVPSYSPTIDCVTPERGPGGSDRRAAGSAGDWEETPASATQGYGNCLPCNPCSPDQISDWSQCRPCNPCSPDQLRDGSQCLPCNPCSPDELRDGSQCLPCNPCSPDQIRDGGQCLPCNPCSPDQIRKQ